MAVTLAQLILSIRELSFDRFVTPMMYIGANGKPNYRLEITSDRLIIRDSSAVDFAGTPAVPAVPEIAATSSFTCTVAGTAGNTLTLVNTKTGVTPVVLGTAVVGSSPTPESLIESLAADVTSKSGTHGYAATAVGAIIVITAPDGMGIVVENWTLAFTRTGTVSGTVIQWDGAVDYVPGVPEAPATTSVKTELLYKDYPTMDAIATALITDAEGYAVSYAASFMGADTATNLLPLTSRAFDAPVPLFKRYFFTDEKIEDIVRRYLEQILSIQCKEADAINLEEFIPQLTNERPRHLALWAAYWCVDERRVYELAGEILGQSTFSFSGDSHMIGIQQDGGNIDVSIGDAFRLSDGNTTKYNEGEKPYGVGADNVLGDAYSFWYRLELWIRKQVELFTYPQLQTIPK